MLQLPRGGGSLLYTGPQGYASGLVGMQREQGENVLQAFIMVLVGKNGQSRVSS